MKDQAPWSTCWASGGIACAEASILSMGGVTYEEVPLDLSERHLIYFALSPVTPDVFEEQADEGVHMFSTDRNAQFVGGNAILITTLFSQGVSPVPESLFPYHGKDAIMELQYLEEHPLESAQEALMPQVTAMGMDWDQFVAFLEARGNNVDDVLNGVVNQLRQLYSETTTYSKHDDWSIPAMTDGHSNRLLSAGVVLKDGNVLPTYFNEDGTINPASTQAMKRELLEGRAVSLMYHADQSGNFTVSSPDKGTYYAQYVYDKTGLGTNHGVCIVGWDDDYDAANFEHVVYKKANPDAPYDPQNYARDESGQPIVDEEATARTRPLRNGAWIVKNSWGSETDAIIDDQGNRTYYRKYGALDDQGKHTGFFYLSYEDKTIANVETMSFTAGLGSDPAESHGFYTIAYDYMPAMGGFYTLKSDEVMSSANVFTATDEDISVRSISTRTAEPDMSVTFAIYALNEGYTSPTDGKLVYESTHDFPYSGFHRLDLDTPIRFAKDTTFSIVSMTSSTDATGKRSYSVSANRGIKESDALNNNFAFYTQAIVNEGESYMYDEGTWTDWKTHLQEAGHDGEVDNFSIKLYAEKDTYDLVHMEAKEPTCDTAGNIEYWYDASQNKFYANAQGTKELKEAEVAIAALGHDWDEGKETTIDRDGKKVRVRLHTCKHCGVTMTEGLDPEPSTDPGKDDTGKDDQGKDDSGKDAADSDKNPKPTWPTPTPSPTNLITRPGYVTAPANHIYTTTSSPATVTQTKPVATTTNGNVTTNTTTTTLAKTADDSTCGVPVALAISAALIALGHMSRRREDA